MERIFDLNDRGGCATAVIKLAGEEFRINRVVTGARVLYANLLEEMAGMLKETARAQEDPTAEKVAEVGRKVEAFCRRKDEAYGEILTLILEANGQTYDGAWWSTHTDETDVRRFIEACLSKDAPGVKKKR